MQVMSVVVSLGNKLQVLTLFPHPSILAETNSQEKLARLYTYIWMYKVIVGWGCTTIQGCTTVQGYTTVHGCTTVQECTTVHGCTHVQGCPTLQCCAAVQGFTTVQGCKTVQGCTTVQGCSAESNLQLNCNARLYNNKFIAFSSKSGGGGFLTYT